MTPRLLVRIGDAVPDLRTLFGSSAAMERLAAQVAAAAAASGAVLIHGEPGTGKGAVVRWMHASSQRAGGPFVQVASGTVTSQELTRAFDTARGGTLVLRRATALPQELQGTIVERLPQVDVRVLATLRRDPVAEVNAGRLLEPLYLRLSGVVLAVPPLRERSTDDREAVLRHLLSEVGTELGSPAGGPGPEWVTRLARRAWPGNLREMRMVVERAMLWTPEEVVSRDVSLRESERRQVARALAHHGGNRTHTARALGISRVTLLKKIREFGLS